MQEVVRGVLCALFLSICRRTSSRGSPKQLLLQGSGMVTYFWNCQGGSRPHDR
jgi:hypothetical protein